ncbi:MAG: DNA polymerase III subunit delta [Sphingomicrobium sp.]
MKIARGAIGKALDRPDPNVRIFLFHGSDEGQSRSHAQRLLASLGAVRTPIQGSAIKSDPALLAAEAGAMSLFGGRRLIWVEPAGEEVLAGVEAVLEAPASESPVVLIAGALRKTSALLRLCDASPLALTYVSYVPEGQDAERMVMEVGRTLGLKIQRSVALRIAEGCGNDQAIVRQELTKLGLYVDAAPEAPKELEHQTVDELGADLPEGNFLRVADIALSGDLPALASELASLPAGGAEAIPILRSLQRRLMMLAPARARVERGESMSAVMASLEKSLFYKDKALVGRLLQAWDAPGLARIVERAGTLERDIMLTPLAPGEALGEELVAVARAARRR